MILNDIFIMIIENEIEVQKEKKKGNMRILVELFNIL